MGCFALKLDIINTIVKFGLMW